MAGTDELVDALGQAKKLAGKKYKMPPKIHSQLDQLNGLVLAFNKELKTMHSVRDTLEKHVLVLQNNIDSRTNLVKQCNNTVDKETFGLDPKSPEDKKAIDQITKLFDAAFRDLQKENENTKKKLDELDKHIEDISNYKGPS